MSCTWIETGLDPSTVNEYGEFALYDWPLTR